MAAHSGSETRYSSSIGAAVFQKSPEPDYAKLEPDKAFIEAAGNNNVLAMEAADARILKTFNTVTFSTYIRVKQEALLRAAERDAVQTTEVIFDQEKNFPLQKWDDQFVLAFFLACERDAQNVAAFYTQKLRLDSQVLAFGTHKAPPDGPTVRWLRAKLASDRDGAQAAFDAQQEFLKRAGSGDAIFVDDHASVFKRAGADFLLAEAAYAALRQGRHEVLLCLLPEVAPLSLPKIARLAARYGQLKSAEEAITTAHQSFSAQWDPKESLDCLHAFAMRREAARGAATGGHIGVLSKIVASEHGSRLPLYEAAAEAAILAKQDKTFSYILSKVEAEEPVVIGHLFTGLLATAIVFGSKSAQDELLKRGGALCVNAEFISRATLASDYDLQAKLLAAQPQSSTVVAAVTLISAGILETGVHLGAKILKPVVLRASIESLPVLFAALGSVNDYKAVADLLPGRDPLSERTLIDPAFWGAVTYGQRETFDALLPRTSYGAKEHAFDALVFGKAGRPVAAAQSFVNDLIESGIRDPDRLVEAAVRTAITEGPSLGGPPVYFSPTASGIITHHRFPVSRLNDVLAEIGDGGNVAAIEAAVRRGGSQNIADFYKVSKTGRAEELTYYLSRVPPRSLQKVAMASIYANRLDMLRVVMTGASKHLDLERLVRTMVDEGNHAAIRLAVDHNVRINPVHIKRAVEKDDFRAIFALIGSRNGKVAAEEYVLSVKKSGVEASEGAPTFALLQTFLQPAPEPSRPNPLNELNAHRPKP